MASYVGEQLLCYRQSKKYVSYTCKDSRGSCLFYPKMNPVVSLQVDFSRSLPPLEEFLNPNAGTLRDIFCLVSLKIPTDLHFRGPLHPPPPPLEEFLDPPLPLPTTPTFQASTSQHLNLAQQSGHRWQRNFRQKASVHIRPVKEPQVSSSLICLLSFILLAILLRTWHSDLRQGSSFLSRFWVEIDLVFSRGMASSVRDSVADRGGVVQGGCPPSEFFCLSVWRYPHTRLFENPEPPFKNSWIRPWHCLLSGSMQRLAIYVMSQPRGWGWGGTEVWQSKYWYVHTVSASEAIFTAENMDHI